MGNITNVTKLPRSAAALNFKSEQFSCKSVRAPFYGCTSTCSGTFFTLSSLVNMCCINILITGYLMRYWVHATPYEEYSFVSSKT